MGESANIVKRTKSCSLPDDYGHDQDNEAYCVVTCEADEIGLFTFWEWLDAESGERIAGYSSPMQMYVQTVPELQDRYGFAAYVGSDDYIYTRRMNLFLFCSPR
jgi:hypothetical protein